MTAELIDRIPLDALPKPGRVLSEHPAAVRARADRAKAKGKAPQRAKRPRTASRGPKSLRPELAAMLTLLNTAVMLSPLGTRPLGADPATATHYGDELDAAEIDALAGAIDAQCQRSTRFRKYVERFLQAGAGGQLLSVVGMIAVRRASRHGIAPPILDPMLGALLAGDGMAALGDMMPPTEPDTEPDDLTGEVAPDRSDAGEPFDFATV